MESSRVVVRHTPASLLVFHYEMRRLAGPELRLARYMLATRQQATCQQACIPIVNYEVQGFAGPELRLACYMFACYTPTSLHISF